MTISPEVDAYFTEWDEKCKVALSEFSHDLSHIVSNVNEQLNDLEVRLIHDLNGSIHAFNNIIDKYEWLGKKEKFVTKREDGTEVTEELFVRMKHVPYI